MAMLRPPATSGVFPMGTQELVAMAASRRPDRRHSGEPGKSRGVRGGIGAEHCRLGAAFFRYCSRPGWLRFACYPAFEGDGRDAGALSARKQTGSVSDRTASVRHDLECPPKHRSRDNVVARAVATDRQEQIYRSRRLESCANRKQEPSPFDSRNMSGTCYTDGPFCDAPMFIAKLIKPRKSMRTDLFDFELPTGHIALRPASPRDSARMLIVQPDSGLRGGIVAGPPPSLWARRRS